MERKKYAMKYQVLMVFHQHSKTKTQPTLDIPTS